MAAAALLALKSVNVFGPFRDFPSVQVYQGWCSHTWWHREPVHELIAQKRSSGELIFSLGLWVDLLRCWHSKKTRHGKQISTCHRVGLHSACFLLYPTWSLFTQQESPSTMEVFLRKITPRCLVTRWQYLWGEGSRAVMQLGDMQPF